MPPRAQLASLLLVAAALADLVFWLSPPSRVGLGAWGLEPRWPAQALLGAAAALALAVAVRALMGLRAPGWAFALAGALGGFFVAAPLALAAWLVQRRVPVAQWAAVAAPNRARLRQVGVYAAHFAFALALVGYAPSTYAKEHATLEVAAGPAVEFAGHGLRLEPSVAAGPAGAAATELGPTVVAQRGADGRDQTIRPPLTWEPQASSHYPRPGTLRHWDGDLYLQVEAVHVAAGSPCLHAADTEGRWVEAYQGVPARPSTAATIDGARVAATWLPGVGLMWASLALLVLAMATILAASARASPSARAGEAA